MKRQVSIFALCLLIVACGGKPGSLVPKGANQGSCPVCHMTVNSSDPWVAEIVYADGNKLMFESPGDMMAFYTSPEKYDVPVAQKSRANVAQVLVKDYNTKQQVDARQAKFVYKSKVNSPMGADFVPFAEEGDAARFVEENGGAAMSFKDVTPELVQNLRKK
jgi:copper chaperone NosL